MLFWVMGMRSWTLHSDVLLFSVEERDTGPESYA